MSPLRLKKTTLHISLPKSEVLIKLNKNITFGDSIPEKFDKNPFRGYCSSDCFTIRRTIGHDSSFTPRINGKLTESLNGTTIKLVIKPKRVVSILLLIALHILFLFLFGIAELVITGEQIGAATLIPCVMLCAGLVVTIYIFNSECTKAEKKLCEILQARIKSDLK